MYELVIVWETGEKEIYEYQTREAAEEAERGMKMAFGKQLWCGIRKKLN